MKITSCNIAKTKYVQIYLTIKELNKQETNNYFIKKAENELNKILKK